MLDENKKEVILEISHLHKKYDENFAIKDLSLKLHKREVVVLVGSSGCGKSTLLRCINLLEDVQGGEIKLCGETISNRKSNLPEIRQKIGMVFQNYELFPHKNVLDNIILAPIKVQKRRKEEAIEDAKVLLKRVGLEGKAYSMPSQLSGGQKQRVAIVRALCMNPEILLFDEVTASLDPEMTREVLEVILELADMGKTMLVVTHEMQFARAVADRIVFMDEGSIVEATNPEDFFESPKSEKVKAFLDTFTYKQKRK